MALKKRKAPWIDRRCCDWDTFLSSLMAAAQRRRFPLLLVNWCEARRYCQRGNVQRIWRASRKWWKSWWRWACEPYEAISNQASYPGVIVQGNLDAWTR